MSKKVIDIYSPSSRERDCNVRNSRSSCKGGKGNFFLLALIIFFSLGGYFYYTSHKTSIVIYPKVEAFKESKEVLVRIAGVLNEDNVRGVILSERLQDTREFEIETVKMVEEKAEGKIKVCQKHTSSTMNFLQNTRFISDGGKYFVSKEAFVLPGKDNNGGCKMVEVVAMEAGEDHNISPESNFTIPGLLGYASYANVNGEEFNLTKAGVKREVPDLDEETRHNAEKQMLEDLLEKGFQKIKEQGEGQYFLESDNQFKVDIIEREFEEVEGENDKFLYKLDVIVRAIAISRENIDDFIEALLPTGSTWRKETEKIDIEFLYFDFEDEEAEAVVDVSLDVYDDIDKEGLKRMVAGLSFTEAEEKIKSEMSIEKITIKSFPFGFSRILEDYDRVEVRLQFDKN